jgi:hypothetical protein
MFITQGDQVVERITAAGRSRLPMMDLQLIQARSVSVQGIEHKPSWCAWQVNSSRTSTRIRTFFHGSRFIAAPLAAPLP